MGRMRLKVELVITETFSIECFTSFSFSIKSFATFTFLASFKTIVSIVFIGKKQDELVEILEAEEDFKSGKTLLEEEMAEMGARVKFLPKFHPEFAPIECVYR